MNSGVVVSRTEVFGATGQIVLSGGNFFMIIVAGAAVIVNFERNGVRFGAENVLAGYVTGKVEPWEKVRITGTPASSITYFHGYEDITEDFTDYRRTVGVFQPQQPSTIADAADVDVGSSAVAVQIVAANAARASVTITNLDTSLTNVRVGLAGTVAAARGQRLTPGQSVTLRVTGAIHAIRETAAACAVCVLEENY